MHPFELRKQYLQRLTRNMITTARSPDRATLPGRDDHETQRLHHIHPHRHYHIMAHRISNRVVISRRALSGPARKFCWGLDPGGGVAEVEAAGGVEGVFAGADG